MTTYEWLGLVAVMILGLIMGSFATVLCYRIPREIPLGLKSHRRSRCTNCDAVIAWWHNVPVLSFVLLRGKCADCEAKIPWSYPLIEICTTLLFACTYLIFMRSPDRILESQFNYLELAKVLYFSLALIVVVYIDLEFRIIPDRFSIGGFVVALALSYSHPGFLLSLGGAAFGFGAFFLLAWTYEKLKGIEGLGFGDVKMMAWLGAWVGFFCVPFVILVASLTGLVVGVVAMRTSKQGLQTAIPFGPFLALGGYVAWAIQALGIWSL